MMLLLTIITVLISWMFWYERMSVHDTIYKPNISYKPTKKERYIKNISKLLTQGHYELVNDLLSRTKYSRNQLPFEHWKNEISSKLLRIVKESKQLESLKNLEQLLDS